MNPYLVLRAASAK